MPRRYRARAWDAVNRRYCPRDAVYVGRASLGWPGTPWANTPFDRSGTVAQRLAAQAESVRQYRERAIARLAVEPDWLLPLRGRDLLCWCEDGAPCHATVLLELLKERYDADA
jgi:hypothetical protein